MATDYSKYSQSQYDNQKTYLQNVIDSGSAGNKAWAQAEMEKLNTQYKPQNTQASTSQGSVTSGNNAVTNSGSVNTVNKTNSQQTQAQKQASVNNSTGKTGTSSDNKYGTSYKYKDGQEYTSTDGGKTYSNTATGEQIAGNTAQSSAGMTGNWNNAGQGASGKQFEVNGTTGSIIVTYSDGSYRLVNPTDSDYMATRNAMAQDLADNGINYTPSKTWSVTKDYYKIDGSGELDYSQDEAYTYKDYLTGNSDLTYALEQYMKDNNTNVYDIEGYAKSLYDRIGTPKADGSGIVTLDDVNAELARLGLSDYGSDTAIHTSGGALLPGNQFVDFSTGQVMGSGDGLDFSNGEFASYNGQNYLIGGDVADFLNYVQGKTGNLTNLDYLFDDVANNPYVQGDAEYAQMYQDALNQFNGTAGIQTPTVNTGIAGSSTGYSNVDSFIDYVNSLQGYDQATGTTGSSDIWSEIKAMLDGGYEAQQEFLNNQRTQAEQNAENLMRQAYVNQKLQGDSVKEAMSAAGLGTTGAMQSAMLGVQSNYNNNVGDIRSNLNNMLSSFDEQELQALTDYMNKQTDYYYQVQNDQQDRALQNAQLYLQQMEMQQAQQQQDWENAYKQQLLDIENQQYADSQAQSKSDAEYERKQNEAAYYAQLYNAGAITAQQYQQFLQSLGLIA